MTMEQIVPAKRESVQMGDLIEISRIAHGKLLVHRGVVSSHTIVGMYFPRHELWFEDGFNVFMEDWGVTEIHRKVHTAASLSLEQEAAISSFRIASLERNNQIDRNNLDEEVSEVRRLENEVESLKSWLVDKQEKIDALYQEIDQLKNRYVKDGSKIGLLRAEIEQLKQEAEDANNDRHLARTALAKAQHDAKIYKSLLDEVKEILP